MLREFTQKLPTSLNVCADYLVKKQYFGSYKCNRLFNDALNHDHRDFLQRAGNQYKLPTCSYDHHKSRLLFVLF